MTTSPDAKYLCSQAELAQLLESLVDRLVTTVLQANRPAIREALEAWSVQMAQQAAPALVLLACGHPEHSIQGGSGMGATRWCGMCAAEAEPDPRLCNGCHVAGRVRLPGKPYCAVCAASLHGGDGPK